MHVCGGVGVRCVLRGMRRMVCGMWGGVCYESVVGEV